MKIDPWVITCIQVVAALATAIGAGSFLFPGISDNAVHDIRVYALDVALIINIVGATSGLFTSSKPGPLSSDKKD